VGEVVSVRSTFLQTLLALGLLPVISPISLGEDGEALNVNADEIATAVAQAVAADELLFLTDVPAVRGPAGPLAEIGVDEAKRLIDTQVATGGMAVKLSAAIAAVAQGVGRVRVGSLDIMNDPQAGTVVRREEALV
jgi:acetylglutamate kinase